MHYEGRKWYILVVLLGFHFSTHCYHFICLCLHFFRPACQLPGSSQIIIFSKIFSLSMLFDLNRKIDWFFVKKFFLRNWTYVLHLQQTFGIFSFQNHSKEFSKILLGIGTSWVHQNSAELFLNIFKHWTIHWHHMFTMVRKFQS